MLRRRRLNQHEKKAIGIAHDADLERGVRRRQIEWLLRQPDAIVIPKAAGEAHVRDDGAALDLTLTADDLAELDRAFPPPTAAEPLAMI